MEKLDLSIVIPCYMDAPHLEANFDEIRRMLERSRLEWEVIFVNDKSPDNCEEVIDGILAKHPALRLRKISHEVNTGRGRAVMDGIRAAQGTVVGFLDIDLEAAAWYVLPCVGKILDGEADMATIHRVYKLRWGVFVRAFLSRNYLRLENWVFGTRFADTEAGYKFFHRETMREVMESVEDKGWFWDTEVMLRAAAAKKRIAFIPALFIRRPDKKSTVRLFADCRTYFKALWRFRQTYRNLCRQHAAAPLKHGRA